MEMENRASASILDLTLKARHLRSAYLAGIFRRAFQRIRRAAQQPITPDHEAEAAFERR